MQQYPIFTKLLENDCAGVNLAMVIDQTEWAKARQMREIWTRQGRPSRPYPIYGGDRCGRPMAVSFDRGFVHFESPLAVWDANGGNLRSKHLSVPTRGDMNRFPVAFIHGQRLQYLCDALTLEIEIRPGGTGPYIHVGPFRRKDEVGQIRAGAMDFLNEVQRRPRFGHSLAWVVTPEIWADAQRTKRSISRDSLFERKRTLHCEAPECAGYIIRFERVTPELLAKVKLQSGHAEMLDNLRGSKYAFSLYAPFHPSTGQQRALCPALYLPDGDYPDRILSAYRLEDFYDDDLVLQNITLEEDPVDGQYIDVLPLTNPEYANNNPIKDDNQ